MCASHARDQSGSSTIPAGIPFAALCAFSLAIASAAVTLPPGGAEIARAGSGSRGRKIAALASARTMVASLARLTRTTGHLLLACPRIAMMKMKDFFRTSLPLDEQGEGQMGDWRGARSSSGGRSRSESSARRPLARRAAWADSRAGAARALSAGRAATRWSNGDSATAALRRQKASSLPKAKESAGRTSPQSHQALLCADSPLGAD